MNGPRKTYEIIQSEGLKIADLTAQDLSIRSAQEALELLVNLMYAEDARHLLLAEHNLDPQFFDLKTGLAGEVLQKFSNYNGFLAIVGDFSKFGSKSLHDFIRESNRQKRVFFVETHEAGVKALSGR